MTALESRIRAVRMAIAPSTTAGAETRKSGRWCSPTANHVEAELVGELGLLYQLAHAPLGADPAGEVSERGEPEFHPAQHSVGLDAQIRRARSAAGCWLGQESLSALAQ